MMSEELLKAELLKIESCTQQVVHDVLSLVFNLQAEYHSEFSSQLKEANALTQGGVVYIIGDWLGSVSYQCSDDLVSFMTAQMFGVEKGCCDPSLERSVICELANMIGGNLKSILGEHCILSLPKPLLTEESNEALEHDTLILSQSYLCAGQPLLVEVRRSNLNIQELLDAKDFEYPGLRQSTAIGDREIERKYSR